MHRLKTLIKTYAIEKVNSLKHRFILFEHHTYIFRGRRFDVFFFLFLVQNH
ncbi:unnamed protein product [Meloidogyne enterolobii]|uniref:Uncharacterized protein n=1 Tax=Meloidogyne enterolobii TaxID=390850 RepID=A0ACB1AF13_MELEN